MLVGGWFLKNEATLFFINRSAHSAGPGTCQRAEDRGQREEGRGTKAEGRGVRAEGRGKREEAGL